MGNDPRSARKGKGDEPNGSKKKQRDGKDELVGAASNSASGSGESSGLRRSTRETPSKKHGDNASPVSIRKSQRLENRTAPATPSATSKKKPEKPSPLRRSGRDNKFQSPSSRMSEKGSASKGGLKRQKGSKSPALKEKNKDKIPKKGAEESNGIVQQVEQKPKVGTKRKQRLTARHYRDMFRPLKKKIKVSDSATQTRLENCNDDGGDRESESDKEGHQHNSDVEELKEDCAKNADADSVGSDSDSKKQVCLQNRCESEALERLRPSLTADVPMSSPGTEARKNEVVDMEADSSIREQLDRRGLLTSNELSNDINGLTCVPKVTTLRAPVVGSEDAHTCSEDVVPSIPSSCKMISLNEQCTKCFRKRRLEYNASKQVELCCCLPNLMDDVHMISVFKDRGECGTFLTLQCADKHGQNIGPSEPTDGERRTCCTCKSAGMLLHCIGKGCTRSYHASCLLTPEENLFLPIWYCCECTKKRLTLGVHSLSEGIESIWDVREVELSNSTGVKEQKQYSVKYKGLAHIHNHWVPEIQLRHEVPELLAEFDEKKEGMRWKPEWVIPHRLLKKRLLNADTPDNEPGTGFVSNGLCEWLVKWSGLGYDQATWEFEDSSCFKAPDVQRLKREYEARHERARTPVSKANETQERRKGSHVKVGRLSGGGGFGADSCYMNSVNKLREYYHKRQNAVILDEQDRIVKVVYLVSSLVVNIARPILIISPCAFLSVWEAEFLRLAASINVVVYGGNRDARNIIRSVEFYEGGNIMLQVLLSSIEVVSEDLNMIKGIQWEAIIVDSCQQSCVMEHCGSIKSLVADWRLLLVTAQLKDDVGDYINILSLLESGDNSNQDSGPIVDSSVNINILKGRLSQFICCAKFLEYWVPVQISNLQLEQYCSLILSNRTALLSSSKSDPVGSLRDILISTRKCCDHPYIVDRSLQASLIGGLTNPNLDAVLDLGTRASGKLTLLDEILSEFRNLGLKVLILFQSVGGSGRDSKGDILDDFLRLRFGSDSYEHVDSGCLTSKKLAALNKFNKEKERSFFLLETRACLPSIKLSLLDAVIIFDSDWNPLNDLRALQKITIDSKLEQIKVFRLYCTCTVEEKVLILAKNDMSLDSTLQGIIPSTSHMLLMWGSTYLFTRLDEFHQDKVADCKENIVPENLFMKHVCAEILSSIQNQETVNSSKFISVARQNGGGYLKNVALIGEQKIQLEDGIPSHLFWMKLLEGKQPQWRYLSGSSQRNRKRVHYQELGDPGDEDTKKSRKMERTKVDSSWEQPLKNMEKSNAGKKGSQENLGIGNNVEALASSNLASHDNSGITLPTMANDIPGAPQVNCVEPDDRKNLYNEQWGLFQMLKPAVARLSETLHLKDDGKRLAEQFLEYVLKNHRVMAEPEAILQAFQISVCWTAAEALNHKIDHRKSLVVARENMNFDCREEEAEAIYSKTKMFMKIFLRRSEVFKISNSSNDSALATIGVTSRSKEHCIELEGLDKQILSLTHMNDNKNDTWRFVKKVKKKCDKHVDRLKEKHNDELERFEQDCEEKRAELEKKYKMESAIICSIHGKSSVGVEKLKIMDKNCAKEREDVEFQILNRRKELEARQQAERDEEQKKTANWLEQVKSLVQNELLDSPTSESGKQSQSAQQIDWEPSNASASVNRDNLVNIDSDRKTLQMNEQDITSEVMVSEVPCLATDEQRVNHQNDGSINSLKDMPSSEEAGLNSMAEKSCHAELPKMQAVPIAETVSDSCGQVGPGEQPCAAPSREMEKNNNVMEPLEIHSCAVHVNDASASLSTKPLSSPGISLTKRLVADPAIEAPSMSQGIGDESCRDMAGGADKQVNHVAGMLNVSPGGETTSLVCSDLMPCTLSPNAGVGGLPVAESFVPESIVALTHSNDQTRAVASSRADNQSGEIHTSVDGTVAQIQPDHCVTNSGEHVSRPLPELAVDHTVNANLGQFETHTATTRGTSPARASRPNPQVPIFAISRSSDPLQNELERICKEIDEVISIHEETKLRLGSERDKEIEEVVAQIRKKYDEKIKEVDVSFTLKRNELEMNQNKVMMHKILAEAFRSKCMDYRAASGMQQAIPSGSMEHVSQMQSATTTSTSGSFSAILPTVGPHSAAPTARAVQSSLAIASSPTARPQIHPLAPASGLQVRSAIRAPAPHLHSFRPASVTVSTSYKPSVSCGVSVQQSSLSKSFSAPLFPPRPPSQPSPMPPPALLNSYDQSHQAGHGGSTSAPLSLSVTELLMENGMQNETNVCCFGSFSSPLPDNVQNSRSQDIAQVETTTNLQMPSPGLVAGNNVVCLSDDE